MEFQLRVRSQDVYLLTFPSAEGGGVYRSHAEGGSGDTLLSTPSAEMFHGWVGALQQARRDFTIVSGPSA